MACVVSSSVPLMAVTGVLVTRAKLLALARWTIRVTLAVVLWGAFVRLSGSGDGCGKSWPLCQGVLFPASAQIHTYIELFHRITSGVSFLLVAALWFLTRRFFRPGHPSRTTAGWAFGSMVLEVGIGGALVLFGWVNESQSAGRSILLSVHLVNTFFMLATLALTLFFSSSERRLRLAEERAIGVTFLCGFILIAAAGVFGILGAIANMLYSFPTFASAVAADFSSQAPLLTRLRVLHPLLAVALLVWTYWTVRSFLPRRGKVTGRRGRLACELVLSQFVLGVLVLISGGPVALKLLHLFVADVFVMVYAVLAADMLSEASEGRSSIIDAVAPQDPPLPIAANG